MADDIVVLDSDSDADDNDINNSVWNSGINKLQSIKTIETNKHGGNNANYGKRKLQLTMEDDEGPIPKRPPKYPEDTTKIDAANTTSTVIPKIPQIVAVETLATPSATPPLQLLASPPRTPKDSTIRTLSPKATAIEAIDFGSPKSTSIDKTARRIKPTTLLKDSDEAWQELRQKRLQVSDNTSNNLNLQKPSELIIADVPSLGSAAVMDLTHSPETKSETNAVKEIKPKETHTATEEKPPLEREYEELISVCRKADNSADMEKLIETKLLRYYYSVHPDFLKSRGFRKTVTAVTERIREQPKLVYLNLKTVVDELNVRRKSKNVVITNDEASPSAGGNGVATGNATVPNKHTEAQIKKLNKALYKLKKRIYVLEESEVDWEDEDSTYLQVERFKKRACQIYEKICDLTGESKNARRLVKKPIQFSGTDYPVFNKTLQAYINRTKQFPDFYDVLKMLEHCNKQYDLKLATFEIKRIAQDAFLKVGKTLQSRRKTDLYETVSHFTANMEDPAKTDPELKAKLDENQKQQTRISAILETYARAQDDPDAAAALQNLKKENEDSSTPTDFKENGKADDVGENKGDGGHNNNDDDDDVKKAKHNKKLQKCLSQSDDDDESDDDEDDEENLETLVDNLNKDNTIDLSDDEVEMNEDTKDSTEQQTQKQQEKENNETTNKETIKLTTINAQLNLNKNDLELTENNNIMRTKTCNETEKTKETPSIVTTLESSITATEITKTIDSNVVKITKESIKEIVATVSENINDDNKNALSTTKDVSNKNSPTKMTPTSRTAFKDPKLLRTIAEIVISDEE